MSDTQQTPDGAYWVAYGTHVRVITENDNRHDAKLTAHDLVVMLRALDPKAALTAIRETSEREATQRAASQPLEWEPT